jgi:cytosine/uracil/thiamine/allantoin permease
VIFGGGVNGISGVLIVSAFIIYLTRPNVKKYFEKNQTK